MNEIQGNDDARIEPSKILIVDDMPKNLVLLYEALKKKGHKIFVANNGKSAIRRVKIQKPDLILLDVLMPEMNGFETCRALKADADTRDIPVIFLTTLADPEDKEKAFQYGGVDYITKPFKPLEAVARVELHLELRRQRAVLESTGDDARRELTDRNTLFAVVAHDLKDPLRSLVNLVGLLNSRYDELDEEKRRKYVADAETAARRSFDLLENLLNWAKSQSGGLTLSPESISVRDLIEETIEGARSFAKERGVRVLNMAAEDARVFADRPTTATVLRNLVVNAIKFSKEGSEATVNAETDGEKTLLTVKDSGMGMDEETAATLFEANAVEPKPDAEGKLGTGLGLRLGKDFVERNGGTIGVSGSPGEGSEFRVTLPAAPPR
jgi:two-component system sensor histidine kinase/response regulator